MSRTARWLLAALAIGTAAPAAELVNLGFDTPPGWTLPAAWAVADGELRATVSASHARLLVPETAGLVNQTVRVTIRQIDGQVSQLRAGLIFRAPDADNGYFVLIRGDGAYWLGKLVGGKPIPTLTGFVGAVRTSGPNTITVVCEGERQSISLNDTRLLSRSDPAYAYGGVGLWAEGTGTAAFDGLCIADDSPEPPRVDTAPAATTVPRVAEVPGGEPPRPAAPVLDPTLPEPTER
ncbi:MAG: hypothetical protein HUU35_12125, partial [Armatimonadetes bacterium]|nr:hypothetical protein [Armatimonadota bacterium]